MAQQGQLEVVAALTAGVRRFQPMEGISSLTAPLLPPSKSASQLTRSAGGFERMIGVFCMTEVLVSSLPSCGQEKAVTTSKTSICYLLQSYQHIWGTGTITPT